MTLLPTIPEPTGEIAFPVTRVCADVVAWAQTVDDIDAINESKHKLAAIDLYLQRTSTAGRAEVAAAMRRLEVRIGELLGEARPRGGDRKSDQFAHEQIELEPRRIHEFRQMAANPAIVEEVIAESSDEAPASRRAVLERIKPHVAHNSGNNEWYTPEPYIAAARSVMGGIDLDPATSTTANGVVEASKIYTVDDNGLEQDWNGRVWMNPPYAQPAIEHFCRKLVEEYNSGSVTEACVLVNNATETAWFQMLAQIAGAICFPKGRIKFWAPDKEKAAPLQGQAVIYLGTEIDRFVNEFREHGEVFRHAR